MRRSTIWLIVLAVVIVVVFLMVKGRDESQQMTYEGFELRDVGLKVPESVLYDPGSDVYLVSNINGSPTDVDDNGFISRISPDGSIIDLKWINGEDEGVSLSAPKGMAIYEDRIYVADISMIKMFDIFTGEPVGALAPSQVSFLNDIYTDEIAGLYFTDSGLNPDFSGNGTDAVFYVGPDNVPMPMVRSTDLKNPNGIITYQGDLAVVTFGAADVLRVDPISGTIETLVTLPTGGLDGIVKLPDGRLLVSSWEGSMVYVIDEQGIAEPLVEEVTTPADIGYDSKRNLVLIPLFNEDAVVVVPIEK